MNETEDRQYLTPYVDAARLHGAGFNSLLWASPSSQRARFDALARILDFRGKSILDAGCGRADLLDYFLDRRIYPNHYVGLEALEDLATAAEKKHHTSCTIVRADFIAEPIRMFVGADVVLFCGSLNTLTVSEFYKTLTRAIDAATDAVVFNFLSSDRLAAAKYLTWHHRQEVESFARTMGERISVIDDYIEGDCTIAIFKPDLHR